jgi:cysteinyl-tRNA synthetase
MSMKYLGESFDIHGGGLENVFPHHECEIAQSEAANDRPFAGCWMHNNMVTVGGQKMGKSLGNFVTLKAAFATHNPQVIRFFILNSHYRSPLDYSDNALDAAAAGLEHLLIPVAAVKERLRHANEKPAEETILKTVEEYKKRFIEAMDDDFNTAEGLGTLFQFSREVNTILNSGQEISRKALQEIDSLYKTFGGDVLGVITERPQQKTGSDAMGEEALIKVLVDTRENLRKAEQWQLADQVRDEIAELGIILEDTSEGVKWRRKL